MSEETKATSVETSQGFTCSNCGEEVSESLMQPCTVDWCPNVLCIDCSVGRHCPEHGEAKEEQPA